MPIISGGTVSTPLPEDDSDAIDIEAAAVSARQVQVDGMMVTERTVSELIEADRYLKSRDAVSSTHRGLRFNKLSPPGAS